jgi:aspartate/methionine/tyrosine aminotransferase
LTVENLMPETPDLHDEPDFEALRARAFNLRWASVAPDVIPLTAADPDLPVARVVTDAISEYVRTRHLCYGPPMGLDQYRGAVARHFTREKNAPVENAPVENAPIESARVVATNSAASALTLVARHLLRAGDEVIIQDPVDFLVAESARRAGATLRFWKPDNGRFTLDGLRAALTANTRLISVCHPHNPLGSLWSAEEVQAIADLARERSIQLISDEVWSDVLLDGARFTSFAQHVGNGRAHERADDQTDGRTDGQTDGTRHLAPWVIYGLSKGYALAGLRIGAVIAPDATAALQFATAQGFDHTIEGAATLSQIAATAALEHAGRWRDDFLAHCTRKRDLAIARLNALDGVHVARPPQATFVLFADIRATGIGESELAQRIETIARVRVVPGSPRWFGAGAAGHIRLSLATTRAVLDEALTRIERAWPAILAAPTTAATND